MEQSASMIIIGGLVRMIEGLIHASPTLLVGLFVAAILRYYLGHAGTRRLFGGDTLRSLPQSWLLGMLLPVCSIGVLPILVEMRRAKVKPGAMSAFALSAPLFNPLSLLYGLTLSRPLVIILFAIGSLLIVTLLGIFWDKAEDRRRLRTGEIESEAVDTEKTDHLIGFRRVIATSLHFSREASGSTLLMTFIALSGLAVLAWLLPYGAMQNSVEQGDWWAPLRMTVIAVPIYATPMLAMSQLGMMFQHANSPGAAFALLIMGTGINLATPLWFGRHYGWNAASVWLLSLFVIVLGISYAINKPLIPHGVDPAGHTHAFDIYTNPISVLQQMDYPTVRDVVTKNKDISEWVSFALLGCLTACGLVLRILKIDEASLVRNSKASSFASSLESQDAPARRGLDMVVAPSLIGVTLMIGLVASSVVACFAYYPSPQECLEEIAVSRVECLSGAISGNVEHALVFLPIWEDWSRRMEVGTFLRTGEVRPYQKMLGHLIRKKLELLEHELEHEPFEPEETKKMASSIFGTNARWVRAFTPEKK
jgi:uncharacterized protein